MGRPRKPTTLKLISSGHIRADRATLNEPMPDEDLNAPPSWMTKSQAAVWQDYIKKAPQGLLKELDAETFSTFVVAVDLRREALRELEKSGSLLEETTNGNMIQSNYLSIVNRQAEIIGKAASELGFTPTSRTRISLGTGKEKKNPFAKHAAKG